MGGFKIVDPQGEMKLVVAQIIGPVPVAQPGQLKAVAGDAVAQKYNGERAVGGLLAADFGEAERLPVEGEGAVKVENIDVIVVKTELHGQSSSQKNASDPALSIAYPGKKDNF